ncbi:MAG TPA: thioredoxin family protein, partial [Candidatus Rifleibacterium sp.]|nr:thioredoxin family protein [Candidatus Rifleibacterium sp.]
AERAVVADVVGRPRRGAAHQVGAVTVDLHAGATVVGEVVALDRVVAVAVACAFAISAASQWGCLCLPKSAAEKQEDKAETFWQHDLQAALKEAAATGKPLFLDFRADWCTVCKDLELNVFPRPEIRSLLGRMVPVKIDATSPDDEKVNALLKQFGIVGLPTLVILQPDGNEVTSLRTVGFISPEHLEKKLRAALP